MMNGRKVSLFILLQILAYVPFLVAVSGLSRSAYFTTRENKRLTGQLIKRVDSPSMMSCSLLCLRDAWCTSTNFSKKKGKETCELNKHGVIDKNNYNFHDQEGVTFSLLLKVKYCYHFQLLSLKDQ